MDDSNYLKINRSEWKELNSLLKTTISEDQISEVKSLNDRLSIYDVQEVYLSLISFLKIKYDDFLKQQGNSHSFLKLDSKLPPFVIGISGSVAVGKSTTARLIQLLLVNNFPQLKVQLLTTDGFLYPNKILKEKNILNRKGFPESYNMESLLNFLTDLKILNGPLKIPKYSHAIYDIVPNEFETIDKPDILILEGINVLQLPPNQRIYISDFFDWSIYVDAEESSIKLWFLQRFKLLLKEAEQDPNNFYYKYSQMNQEEALLFANDVWEEINSKNLNEFILPTRDRSDFIIHKTNDHYIDYLLVKKY